MKIERRNCDAGEIRMDGDGDDRRMVGYAAVFYREGDPSTEYWLWDGAVERIMPGAFDDISGDDVRALFNHDPSLLLGRSTAGTLSLSVDDKGLRYEITPGDTTASRDVQAHLERGDLSGSSFGFRVQKEEWVRGDDAIDIRHIRSVSTFDVGPVTYPAYGGTESGIRKAGESAEARANYDAWKAEQAEADARAARILERLDQYQAT